MNIFERIQTWSHPQHGVARFPLGGPGDPPITMLQPHSEAIAVNSVVGSVDRYAQLDRHFRPNGVMTPRLRGIQQAMEQGTDFPPIVVYRLNGACYVVDGHHRIAAARATGKVYVDAWVTECRLQADEAADPLETARVDFALRTGLRAVAFSEPDGYAKTLAQVHEHHWYLGERGRVVSLQEAADDWYHAIYLPVIQQVAAQHLSSLRAPRDAGDLYLQLSDLKYGVSRERGHDIGFTQAIGEWTRRHRRRTPIAVLGRLLSLTVLSPV